MLRDERIVGLPFGGGHPDGTRLDDQHVDEPLTGQVLAELLEGRGLVVAGHGEGDLDEGPSVPPGLWPPPGPVSLPWSGRRPSPAGAPDCASAAAIHRNTDGVDAGGDDVLGILRRSVPLVTGLIKRLQDFSIRKISIIRVQKGFPLQVHVTQPVRRQFTHHLLDDVEVQLLLQLRGAIGKIGATSPNSAHILHRRLQA